MILTQEKAEMLTKYLMEDVEKTKVLLNLPADEALQQINDDGNDFTLDEIKEFGEQLQQISSAIGSNGELNMEELETVAGGVVVSSAVACALIAGGVSMFTAGVTFGYQVARDRGW